MASRLTELSAMAGKYSGREYEDFREIFTAGRASRLICHLIFAACSITAFCSLTDRSTRA
jgi:hypothetical protein